MKRDWALLVFVALVALAGYSGMRHLPGPFYEALTKPEWTPPNCAVPACVGRPLPDDRARGLDRLARTRAGAGLLGSGSRRSALNAAWSWIMFGEKADHARAVRHRAPCGWRSSLFIRLAWPVRRTAALLFVPYFLWVTFAAALNFEIWRLNS